MKGAYAARVFQLVGRRVQCAKRTKRQPGHTEARLLES
jgi:hypothetical protein